MGIVAVNTAEELRKVLALQQGIAEAARAEMLAAANWGVDLDPGQYAAAESRVLENYARYPTRTEFSRMPHLADTTKWGATFAVAALVGALVLRNAQAVLEAQGGAWDAHTGADLRIPYLELLIRLDSPGRRVELGPAQRVLVVLSEQFGLVMARGDELALTVVGQRILLHMFDTEIFLAEMAEAHARLRDGSDEK